MFLILCQYYFIRLLCLYFLVLLTFSEVKRIEQSWRFLVICEIGTYSLLPCAISMWLTTFLILHVALLGSCKTFQRLPIYQCFKRQLNNVICIWATENVNTDWGVIGGMLSAGLTKAAFLQGCCSSAWECCHQIWPLAEHWWPVVLPVALSHIFPPCFWIHSEISALSWSSASRLRCLSCHTPFQTCNTQIHAWLQPSNGQLTQVHLQRRAHMLLLG